MFETGQVNHSFCCLETASFITHHWAQALLNIATRNITESCSRRKLAYICVVNGILFTGFVETSERKKYYLDSDPKNHTEQYFDNKVLLVQTWVSINGCDVCFLYSYEPLLNDIKKLHSTWNMNTSMLNFVVTNERLKYVLKFSSGEFFPVKLSVHELQIEKLDKRL